MFSEIFTSLKQFRFVSFACSDYGERHLFSVLGNSSRPVKRSDSARAIYLAAAVSTADLNPISIEPASRRYNMYPALDPHLIWRTWPSLSHLIGPTAGRLVRLPTALQSSGRTLLSAEGVSLKLGAFAILNGRRQQVAPIMSQPYCKALGEALCAFYLALVIAQATPVAAL